jgi:hypothetical protein
VSAGEEIANFTGRPDFRIRPALNTSLNLVSDQGPFDAKVAGRLPGYDAEAGRMMLSPGNQRGARR